MDIVIFADSCIGRVDLITRIYSRVMMKPPKERNEGAEPEVRGIKFAEMIRSEERIER